MVPPYDSGHARRGLSAEHLCPGQLSCLPARGFSFLTGSHRADHLRSSSPARTSHLARSLFRVPDLSVVVVAASASVLGRLLSPQASPQSRITCSVLPLEHSRDISGETSLDISGETSLDISGDISLELSRVCHGSCLLRHERSSPDDHHIFGRRLSSAGH